MLFTSLLWIIFCQRYQFDLIQFVIVHIGMFGSLHQWAFNCDPSGLCAAFIFGHTSYLDQSFKQSLQFLGAYHVLVVSGYHMMMLRRALRFFYCPGLLVVIVMMVFYIFSGCGLPCARALVMGVLGKFCKQNHPIARTLTTWSILIIIYPCKVLSASMILSMVAGTFMTLGYHSWRGRQSADLFLDVGVSMALSPILYLYGINQSSWSWVLGPIIYPLVIILALTHCFAVLVDVATSFGLNEIIIQLDHVFYSYIIRLDEIMVDRGVQQWPFVICLFFAFCFFFLMTVPSEKIFIVVVVTLFMWSLSQWDAASAKFQCFEVGHGLSCLWYKGRHAVLYDTARPNQGRKIHRFLQQNHIRLDAIIISHSDMDHSGGLHFVKGDLKTSGRIYGSPITKVYSRKDKQCEKICHVDAGYKRCHGPLCWHVHHPKRHYRTQNQMSLVVQLMGSKTILLTGDIDEMVLRHCSLDGSIKLWRSDLWLAPHHGRTKLSHNHVKLLGRERIVIGKIYDL